MNPLSLSFSLVASLRLREKRFFLVAQRETCSDINLQIIDGRANDKRPTAQCLLFPSGTRSIDIFINIYIHPRHSTVFGPDVLYRVQLPVSLTLH